MLSKDKGAIKCHWYFVPFGDGGFQTVVAVVVDFGAVGVANFVFAVGVFALVCF